jgi:hypothetical protein
MRSCSLSVDGPINILEKYINNELKEVDIAAACFASLRRYSGRSETQVNTLIVSSKITVVKISHFAIQTLRFSSSRK